MTVLHGWSEPPAGPPTAPAITPHPTSTPGGWVPFGFASNASSPLISSPANCGIPPCAATRMTRIDPWGAVDRPLRGSVTNVWAASTDPPLSLTIAVD
jgi:hypothetical protein